MSPAVALVDASQPARWREALRGLPHAFGHGPEYVQAAADVAAASAMLLVWTRGAARAACPLLVRDGPWGQELSTPPGFAGLTLSGDPHGLAAEWTDACRALGAVCAYIQLSPWLDPSALSPGAWATHDARIAPAADCLLWDLAPVPETLLAGMSSKHRQLLRKWLRGSPRIVDDQAELQARFPALYAGFIARRAVSPAYRYDAGALARVLGAPGSFLLGARGEDGGIEAATLFVSADGRGDSFLNAATPIGRAHSRGLYWLGALRLREMGVRELNLGGGVAGDAGLADFKQRLGAIPRATQAIHQVLDRPRFARACADAGLDAAAPGGWFPPWRGPAPTLQAGAQTSTCLREEAEAGERSKSP